MKTSRKHTIADSLGAERHDKAEAANREFENIINEKPSTPLTGSQGNGEAV